MAAGIATADQLVKALLVATVPYMQSREVMTGYLAITHRHNTGIAFSLLAGGSDLQRRLLVLATCAALGLLGWLVLQSRPEERLHRAALALVAGGALGNLVDRIRLGYVVDYVDAYLGSHHWPTFNLADSAIVVGAGLILVASLRASQGSSEEAGQTAGAEG